MPISIDVTVDVWLDGLGSAMVGGLVAAATAVLVVKMQAREDRGRENRAEDVRVAVALQRSAIAYVYAISDKEAKESVVNGAVLDLWANASEAITRRPQDDTFRDWVTIFQRSLIATTDSWRTVVRSAPRGADLTDGLRTLITWSNSNTQAIASHLEEGKALGERPAALEFAFGND